MFITVQVLSRVFDRVYDVRKLPACPRYAGGLSCGPGVEAVRAGHCGSVWKCRGRVSKESDMAFVVLGDTVEGCRTVTQMFGSFSNLPSVESLCSSIAWKPVQHVWESLQEVEPVEPQERLG